MYEQRERTEEYIRRHNKIAEDYSTLEQIPDTLAGLLLVGSFFTALTTDNPVTGAVASGISLLCALCGFGWGNIIREKGNIALDRLREEYFPQNSLLF